MHIIEIYASAQSGFNHPYESYANFKPSVSLKALVEEGENPLDAAAKLQKHAQDLCDQERARIEAKCRIDNVAELAAGDVQRCEVIVKSYENIIATHPAMLADASSTMDERDKADKTRSLENARNGIESARASLLAARKKLAHLKPEDVFIEVDGIKQSRCPLGMFLKYCTDTAIDPAEMIEHLFSGSGYRLNLGAAGVVVLKAA